MNTTAKPAVKVTITIFILTLLIAVPVYGGTYYKFCENFQDKIRWWSYDTTVRMRWLYGGQDKIVGIGDDNVLHLESSTRTGYALGLSIYRQPQCKYYQIEFKIRINNDNGVIKCILYAPNTEKVSDYNLGSENFGVVFQGGNIYVAQSGGECGNVIGRYEKQVWYKITYIIDFENKRFQIYINNEDKGTYGFYEVGCSNYLVFYLTNADCYIDEVYIVGGSDLGDVKRCIEKLISKYGKEWEIYTGLGFFEVDLNTRKTSYYENEMITLKCSIKNKSNKDRKAIYKLTVDGRSIYQDEISIEKFGTKIMEHNFTGFDFGVGEHKIKAIVEYGAEQYSKELVIKINPTPSITVELQNSVVIVGEPVVIKVKSNVEGGTLKIVRKLDLRLGRCATEPIRQKEQSG
jgi:hypothetical protein